MTRNEKWLLVDAVGVIGCLVASIIESGTQDQIVWLLLALFCQAEWHNDWRKEDL